MRRWAEFYYQQLDALQTLRQQERRDLLGESRKHSAMNLLRQIPAIGPLRAALLITLPQTPHRFRTKRQLWAYWGWAWKTSTSGEYRFVEGPRKRSKKFLAIRGLNANHNHDLKNIFQGAATRAAAVPGPFQEFYAALVARGMKLQMARLTLARQIAAITLIVWKKGVHFDAEYWKQQAAGASVESPSHDSFRAMAGWFSKRSGSRVSIQNPVRRRVLRAPSLSINPMPPSDNQKKR